MFVILEGVDGSGKSTLADVVAEKFEPLGGCVRVHKGPPRCEHSALAECIDEEPYGSYAPNSGVNIVADRLHWGCPVYGPLFRPELDADGYGDFGKAGWRYAELFLASRGAVTCLVDVAPETAARRVLNRGSENHFSVEQIYENITEAVLKYQWLCDDSLTLDLHVTEPTFAQLDGHAETLVTRAAKRQFEVNDLIAFPDYIGTPWPDRLVIMAPVREDRLDLLAALPHDRWQNIGVCSSRYSIDQLDYLHRVVNCPPVVGIGALLSDADAFVYQHQGVRLDTVEMAAHLL